MVRDGVTMGRTLKCQDLVHGGMNGALFVSCAVAARGTVSGGDVLMIQFCAMPLRQKTVYGLQQS
jgi:hypothetical protein